MPLSCERPERPHVTGVACTEQNAIWRRCRRNHSTRLPPSRQVILRWPRRRAAAVCQVACCKSDQCTASAVDFARRCVMLPCLPTCHRGEGDAAPRNGARAVAQVSVAGIKTPTKTSRSSSSWPSLVAFRIDFSPLFLLLLAIHTKISLNMGAARALRGTGVGTGVNAATDVDLESGITAAGGCELISDWSNPAYIGHGVAHRDPKTGEPLPATVHIPTDGELHPENYKLAPTAWEDPEAAHQQKRDELLKKYHVSRAHQYRANFYKAVGRIEVAVGSKEAGKADMERGRLEKEVYRIAHPNLPQLHD
ncbi:hypothetical protein GQ54DRAFT_219668 [Martensiomyces pterosporus]|nr:hypothetical protein GQ54DRAFT_219668 [Martensiomyces pterosporus]